MRPRRPVSVRLPSEAEVEAKVREMRGELEKNDPYRSRSLRLHGLICARCAREFDEATAHLLTVHHKDGNHHNNPSDGSNWENLCRDCHDDIHARGALGEYLSGGGGGEP